MDYIKLFTMRNKGWLKLQVMVLRTLPSVLIDLFIFFSFPYYCFERHCLLSRMRGNVTVCLQVPLILLILFPIVFIIVFVIPLSSWSVHLFDPLYFLLVYSFSLSNCAQTMVHSQLQCSIKVDLFWGVAPQLDLLVYTSRCKPLVLILARERTLQTPLALHSCLGK